MGKLEIIRGVLNALTKIKEAKEDDGKIDAGEAIEIVLSVAGAALGVDLGKLMAWVKATEDLIGEGVLSGKIGFLGKTAEVAREVVPAPGEE